MNDEYTIRSITNSDAQQALALLPSLADFELPEGRNPDDLWQGDAKLLKEMLGGKAPNTHALVAIDVNNHVQGLAIYTMRNELLSGEPSAHLEVLVVNSECRRQGVGQALIDATEAGAKQLGAKSLTLHVFANNARARGLYSAKHFQEELIRCYKPL